MILKISVEVQGKGKGYSAVVEVQPHDPIEVLRSKIHFFKLFVQRRHQLADKESDKVFNDFSMTFRECGL